MIPELQKQAFRLHSRIFFILHPVPLSWNTNFSTIKISRSVFIWVSWLFSLSCISMFGIASLFVPFFSYFIPQIHMEKIQTVMLVLVGILILLITIVGFITIKNIQVLISTFNASIVVYGKLARGNRFYFIE